MVFASRVVPVFMLWLPKISASSIVPNLITNSIYCSHYFPFLLIMCISLRYKHITQLNLPAANGVGANEELLTSRSVSISVHPADVTFMERLKRQGTKYINLISRRSVVFLLVLLCFNAVTLSFYTLTFQACLSNTFSERSIIPLMQLILGVFEVVGSVLFERVTAKIGNKISAIVLYVITLAALFLVFLSFDLRSPHENVIGEITYVTPTTLIVMIIAVLIAIFDLGYNILANYMVGILFLSDSEIGYGILNSSMSLITGSIFFLSSFLNLYVILGVLVVMSTAATIVIIFDLAVRSYTPADVTYQTLQL